MTAIKTLPIDQIVVTERRRQEYGDLGALARSINKYGLLHPIIVSGNELVAGERRLKAMQQAGYEHIEARDWGELDEDTRRAIELEENERRKDLTPAEKSRRLVREAAQAETELRAKSAPKPGPGRPVLEGASRNDVADTLGIPLRTIQVAEQHVAAVEQFPELETAPQSVAIETARTLVALPAPERETVREQLARQAEEQQAVDIEKAMSVIPEVAQDYERAKLRANYSKLMQHAQNLAWLDPAAVVATFESVERQRFPDQAEKLRTWLDRVDHELCAPTGLCMIGGHD